MEEKPLISIAMATYNGEKYIREQLDSILNQTYTSFELIICDDGSTDKTRSILQEYSQKDKRIKLYFNENNLGFKKNFEKSVYFTQGKFIAFCDQDDIWEPFKLETSVEQIGDNDVYCSNALLFAQKYDDTNKTMMEYLSVKYIPESNKRKARHFLHHNICQGTTMLCKSDFVKNNLPIPAEFAYHDWYFALLASTQNGLIYDTNCTIKYRQHQNTVTGEKKAETFRETLTKKHDSNICDEYKNNITICSFVSKSRLFSDDFRKYAEDCLKYYNKMSEKKDFSTLHFFAKNYGDFIWDKNPVHKLLFIFKRFLGVIKFKIKHK